MTSRWPRILLETGTAQAGVQAGDVFSLAPDHWLFTSAPYSHRNKPVFSLHAMINGITNGIAYRYSSVDERFEEISYAGSMQHWVPMTTTPLALGDQAKHGVAWTLRFIDDGPAVTTVRRFGPHLCVNPCAMWCDPPLAKSKWTLVRADGTLGELEVIESLDDTFARRAADATWSALKAGALSFQERPRTVGAGLFIGLPPVMRSLDREIAKGIAAQMTAKQPPSWVDFDGFVHHHEPNGSAHGFIPSLFWELTRGTFTKTDAQRIEAQAEFDATPAASRAEIGAVIRALFPDDWQREQQLAEECGALDRG